MRQDVIKSSSCSLIVELCRLSSPVISISITCWHLMFLRTADEFTFNLSHVSHHIQVLTFLLRGGRQARDQCSRCRFDICKPLDIFDETSRYSPAVLAACAHFQHVNYSSVIIPMSRVHVPFVINNQERFVFKLCL